MRFTCKRSVYTRNPPTVIFGRILTDCLRLQVCNHLKMNLKAGVPELGRVIRALKVAKPLQVEPCVAPLYVALRRHAAALHAARRAGVCIRAHKPGLDQLSELADVAARQQAVESPRSMA